jgi:hypothetical protein
MKNTTGQAQHEIPLRFTDGVEGVAVRTGNNAAWLCVCQRKWPLLGYSDAVSSENAYSVVHCPDCARKYRVVAPAVKGVPTHVLEIPDVHV